MDDHLDTLIINNNLITIMLLPASVDFDEEEYIKHLYPDELKVSKSMKSEKRRNEFVRRCAIFHKKFINAPLLTGKSGQPLWPKDWRGSITHKEGHVIVAATQDPKTKWVGVDLEDPSKVHEGLRDRFSTAKDREWIDKNSHLIDPSVLYTALFSVKESLYKSLFPLTNVFFGFHDAEICKWDNFNIEIKLLKNLNDSFPEGHICKAKFEIIKVDSKDMVFSICHSGM